MSYKILHGSYSNDVLRSWQSKTKDLNNKSLIYPVFISDVKDEMTEIKSLPSQYRVGKDKVVEYLRPLVEKGLRTVLLFGIIDQKYKDAEGTNMTTERNPVMHVVPLLKETFKELVVACDVCMCGYTDHGHCGVVNEKGLNNEKSIDIISYAALCYARKGADIVAPSDMMDGRIQAIDKRLREDSVRNRVSIMSYSAKFASSFYGPFRDAVDSSPKFGDRRNYQLPPQSSGLAIRATSRDVEEGADILMVKPGMPYLDIVKAINDRFPEYPLAIYQVSGEYAMLHHASTQGAFPLKQAVIESLQSMQRAGANVLITYFTPQLLDWLA